VRILKIFEKLKEPYEKFDIYGITYPNGQFVIRDKREETETTNEREKRRGRKCVDWSKINLIDLLFKFKIKNINIDNTDRNTMLTQLNKEYKKLILVFNQYNDEKLKFYYLWNKYTKDEICSHIYDYFKNSKRLFEIK
jgi:hypothetical protein